MDRLDAITAKTPSSGGGSRLDYEPTDQEWAMLRRGQKLQRQGVTSESLAAEKAQLAQEAASRQSTRAAEDAEYETRSASMAEQRQRDFDEGAARNAELKASRVTENWQGERKDSPIGFNMRGKDDSTLTYAEKDNGGNQYRPKGWTQEDEDASARASETGSRLERIMRYTPYGDRILGPQIAKQIGKIGKMKSSSAPVPIAKQKKRRT
jgi:hypothetical protein